MISLALVYSKQSSRGRTKTLVTGMKEMLEILFFSALFLIKAQPTLFNFCQTEFVV
jgi:hypothetical protein